MTLPILYSFRRCPYAIRARMALTAAQQKVALREVVLRDKPAEMMAISPKATVPVLHLPDGHVLEESLDIALWALARNDPHNWLPTDAGRKASTLAFITHMDGPFKYHLDRTKYAIRYATEDEDATAFAERHRAEALKILHTLEARLSATNNLLSDAESLADIAIFPFIRQFAHTDRAWWQAQELPRLQNWLTRWLSSSLFALVMVKYVPWKETGEDVLFPSAGARGVDKKSN